MLIVGNCILFHHGVDVDDSFVRSFRQSTNRSAIASMTHFRLSTIVVSAKELIRMILTNVWIESRGDADQIH